MNAVHGIVVLVDQVIGYGSIRLDGDGSRLAFHHRLFPRLDFVALRVGDRVAFRLVPDRTWRQVPTDGHRVLDDAPAASGGVAGAADREGVCHRTTMGRDHARI